MHGYIQLTATFLYVLQCTQLLCEHLHLTGCKWTQIRENRNFTRPPFCTSHVLLSNLPPVLHFCWFRNKTQNEIWKQKRKKINKYENENNKQHKQSKKKTMSYSLVVNIDAHHLQCSITTLFSTLCVLWSFHINLHLHSIPCTT